MTRILEEVMREYRERFPEVDTARRNDTYTHFAWELLRQMLNSVDWTLANEDVDARLHYRILMNMALGAPGPWDAEIRMEQEKRFLDLAKYGPPPTVHIVTQEMFDRTAAEVDGVGPFGKARRMPTFPLAKDPDAQP
jgi:hypothetical protein